MEFVKKHYEKIVLIVVLLGLAVAVAWLPIGIGQARRDIQDNPVVIPARPPVEEPVNVEAYRADVARLRTPPEFQFVPHHKLFNSFTWKMRPDATLIKIETGKEEGPEALEIVGRPRPLNLTVRYERVNPTDQRYVFTVTREAGRNPRPQSRSVGVDEANDIFRLREVIGPAEQPQEFVIELLDTKEELRFTRDRPLVRPEAYVADLRYPPENRPMNNVRVNSIIRFGGDRYKVVAIMTDEVRVLAYSNQKQTTVRLKDSP